MIKVFMMVSAPIITLARNKKSVELDLKSDEGKNLFEISEVPMWLLIILVKELLKD